MKASKSLEPKRQKAFRNKYLAALFAVAALLISSVVSAQLDAAKYSQINGYGFKYKRHVQDSISIVPLSTSPHTPYRAGGIRYRASDSTLQLWTGYQWNSILTGVGNGVDTAYMVNDTILTIETPDEDYFLLVNKRSTDTLYRKAGQDSIFYRIAGVERSIKDSSGTAVTLSNQGTGYRWVKTADGQIKTVENTSTVKWDSAANSLSARVDTGEIATQYDLTQISGSSTFASLTDVTVSSPKNGQVAVYDSITSKWKNRNPVYFNVKDYGAIGDSTTDDRAAIMKARDAAYNGGGVLFFPAGKYRISDSILFQYPIRIQGVGKSGGLHNNQSGGVLEHNRLGPIQTSTEIIVTDGKNGFVFERQADETKAAPAVEMLTISSTATPGSCAPGAFIVIRGMIQGATVDNVTFYGGYNQINVESGYYQAITRCHFSAPQKNGIFTNNKIRTDTGDFTVTASIFSSGTFSTLADTTMAIRWESGGGMRIVNNKFDACEFDTSHAFRYDIYATNVLDPTSVFIIADNSIENYTISGIYLHGVVSPYVRIIQINNNEFTPVGSEGPAIDIDQMEDVNISQFAVRDWSGVHPGPAVKVTNTTKVTIGKGSVTNFSSDIDLTGSTNTHVDYIWGGDVAIGTRNTTNIAAVDATLYTTETILGRATTGQYGSGNLEVASQVPDQDGGDVGYISFSTTSNSSGHKRIGIIGAVTQGSTANERGGKLIFHTKADGSASMPERMSIDNVGAIWLNSGYSGGTITGTPAYTIGVTAAGKMVATTGSSQWTTAGSDIHFNTGNVGIGDATPDVKLDIETASTGSDGLIITNTSSGVAARPIVRLLNDASELGQFGMMSSTHATLPNFTLFEATKSLQFGVDAGVASGGTSVINFVTGGYSVAPSFIIKGTGVLNGSSLAGTGTRMVVADASGDMSTQAIPSAGATIYSGDGTLASDRTVSSGGFTTTWSGTNDNETSLSVVNNGTTNASAISGTANGATSVGVTGTSGSYIGVLGNSTTSTAIQGQSSSGVGVIGVSSTAAGIRAQINPASTNAIENAVTILRTTSAGAGANGIGAAIQYELETATSGTSQIAGSISFEWVDATNGTRTSRFRIKGVNSTADATLATFDGNGNATFGTTNSIVGTATNNNAVAGNIGEYVSSTIALGGAVSLATTTTANVTSISLTAGDWDVTGVVDYAMTSATATNFNHGVSVTSATLGGQDMYVQKPFAFAGSSAVFGDAVPVTRISLASTTTIYLVAQATFSGGSVDAYGTIRARRIR
jgi:hypothetical protein